MNEWRWDGPDLEDEANSRLQGALMNATMMGQGALEGWAGARQRRAAAVQEQHRAGEEADRALWRSVADLDHLGGLGDGQLAERWAACARRVGDPEADRARAAIEGELDGRDPETMRDYRSHRHAAATEPGQAMRAALAEREQRLERVWRPLLEDPDRLGTPELLHGWAAATVAAGTGRDIDPPTAAASAEMRLRRLEPQLMDGYDALREHLTAEEAAAAVAGRRLAFGREGWDTVRAGGATAAAAVRGIALVPGPVGAAAKAGQGAAGAVHRFLRMAGR